MRRNVARENGRFSLVACVAVYSWCQAVISMLITITTQVVRRANGRFRRVRSEPRNSTLVEVKVFSGGSGGGGLGPRVTPAARGYGGGLGRVKTDHVRRPPGTHWERSRK
ncbi:hypothetical protein GCM10010106_13370 [Thermopolyspora flexuosa]|nr:hypothetical protein GCM10010106_13370 [Thermopolyspora flexuosa]